MNATTIQLTQQAKEVLVSADQEARRYRHQYLGTEHLLLGLMQEITGAVSGVFRSLDVDPADVRREIERMVQRGPTPVTAEQLPHTPRARQAIEFASEEARLLDQRCVEPEYLLVGLMRDPDGLAGRVLKNLGLTLERVRNVVLKIRLLQLKIVERAVRPVRATVARKRKMREELLAHLTEIYDEERVRLNNPDKAIEEAARRFGDPAELARELQSAVPIRDRISYQLDRWWGWRAPETAGRYVLRFSAQVFCMFAVTCLLTAAMASREFGWSWHLWDVVRPVVAMALVSPVAVFLLGLFYFKMRDAMFGVFGSRKSLRQVFLFDVLIALVALGSGLAFVVFAHGDLTMASQQPIPLVAAAILVAIVAPFSARFNGPAEIRDKLWACLDIDHEPGDSPALAS